MKFRKHMFPIVVVTPVIFAVGLFLCGPWRFRKWHAYLGIIVLIAFLAACLWPVTTHVTGNTRIQLLKEDGTPLVGLRVEETWQVSGYFDERGTEVKTTDAHGTVHFPPRVAKGSVGMRLLRRGWAFVFDESTEQWEPTLFIEIDLPPGYWLPAAKQDMEHLVHPYFPRPSQRDPSADPSLLSYDIGNMDPLHPHAWIQGRATGIADDQEIVLKMRPANAVETRIIDEENRRATAARSSPP
jgi:hypothetical protein